MGIFAQGRQTLLISVPGSVRENAGSPDLEVLQLHRPGLPKVVAGYAHCIMQEPGPPGFPQLAQGSGSVPPTDP